eukprot:442716-Prymnesium_polylepis.1
MNPKLCEVVQRDADILWWSRYRHTTGEGDVWRVAIGGIHKHGVELLAQDCSASDVERQLGVLIPVGGGGGRFSVDSANWPDGNATKNTKRIR